MTRRTFAPDCALVWPDVKPTAEDLFGAVAPAYSHPGKRPVPARTFYPALKKENVELAPALWPQ